MQTDPRNYSFVYDYNPDSSTRNIYNTNHILWITTNTVNKYNDYISYFNFPPIFTSSKFSNSKLVNNYKENIKSVSYSSPVTKNESVSLSWNVNNIDFASIKEWYDSYEGSTRWWSASDDRSLSGNLKTSCLNMVSGSSTDNTTYNRDILNSAFDDAKSKVKEKLSSALSSFNVSAGVLNLGSYRSSGYAQYIKDMDTLYNSDKFIQFGNFLGLFYVGYDSNGNEHFNTTSFLKFSYGSNINGSKEVRSYIGSVPEYKVTLSKFSGYGSSSSYWCDAGPSGDYAPASRVPSYCVHTHDYDQVGMGRCHSYVCCSSNWSEYSKNSGIGGNVVKVSAYENTLGKTNSQIVDDMVAKYNIFLSNVGYSPMNTFSEFDCGGCADKLKAYENYIYDFSSSRIVSDVEPALGSFSTVLDSQMVLNPAIGKTYELDASVNSEIDETRPVNKAVKYIIKVE